MAHFYNHSGIVTNLTWDELQKYRTIKGNLKMPSLKEVFKLTKNKILMNLEIKDPRNNLVFPHIIKLVEKFHFFNQISISSFHHYYYNNVEEYNKKHKKKLVFGFIYNKGNNGSFEYNKQGHSLNIYWSDVTKKVCNKAHKNGMAVLAWFSLDDEETNEKYKKLIDKGVDVICSNFPLLAKNFRDKYYSIIEKKKQYKKLKLKKKLK